MDAFDEVFQGRSLAVLLRMLPEFLKTRRWFLGKNRSIRSINVLDTITITDTASQILLGQMEYSEGDPEIYVLPGSVAVGEAMDQVKAKLSDVAVMHLREPGGQEGILYSAVWNPAFGDALLGAIARRRRFRGRFGELVGSHTRAFRKAWGERHPDLAPTVLSSEQTNTSIVFGDRFILKMYRRIEPGIHPEIEVGTFLTETKLSVCRASHRESRIPQSAGRFHERRGVARICSCRTRATSGDTHGRIEAASSLKRLSPGMSRSRLGRRKTDILWIGCTRSFRSACTN